MEIKDHVNLGNALFAEGIVATEEQVRNVLRRIKDRNRQCCRCRGEIKECMGSVSFNDFIKAMNSEIAWSEVKELCAKCVLKKSIAALSTFGQHLKY